MTTIEHFLPIPELYDDVLTFYAKSGTGSTPTHIVNYGGAWGEQYVWASEDIPNDPKFVFRRVCTARLADTSTGSAASRVMTSWRPCRSRRRDPSTVSTRFELQCLLLAHRRMSAYALFNTSASVAKMVHKGLKAHIGAHGEPPLGLNYHAELFFAQKGGLTNYEALRAATADAAATLGLSGSLGALAPGLLADVLVYEPDADLLEGDIAESRRIRFTVRGGRVWDASTMEEVWPVKGRRPPMPPINAE
jgi:hypothetical protein